MKNIILFGAGKSSGVLISYLLEQANLHDWTITIADGDLNNIITKTSGHPRAKPLVLDILDDETRRNYISQADLVISLLPPALHIHAAKDCIHYKKSFLTASYVDASLRALETDIDNSGILFLCEMGLDPGIDHMSAMQLIDRIKADGGHITKFASHCGGLVAPASDTNPWHYKISWNPANIVAAAKAGAVYRENGITVHKNYTDIFQNCPEIALPGLGVLSAYPNRDSISYINTYHLGEASDFIRTTLRYPAFCLGWEHIINTGLTSDEIIVNNEELTIRDWFLTSLQTHTQCTNFETYLTNKVPPALHETLKTLFKYLGLFDPAPIPSQAVNAAQVLQYLLEQKLRLMPQDRDMIVMLHEITYRHNNELKQVRSSLIVEGDDAIHTAMAKTVGLPLGIAAKLILTDSLSLKGLHIPISPEIYNPVLKELQIHGINFNETWTAI